MHGWSSQLSSFGLQTAIFCASGTHVSPYTFAFRFSKIAVFGSKYFNWTLPAELIKCRGIFKEIKMKLDRRDFMIGGGVVAAGMALAPVMSAGPAYACPPKAGEQNAGYYKTKVGSKDVFCLLDGGMEIADELMLGAKGDDLPKARDENFIRKGKSFPAYVNAFFVKDGKKLTLIDTGAAGMAPTLGLVKTNLHRTGIEFGDVDQVILTHAHPDHTNGLLNKDGQIAFPKAKIRIHEQELSFWFDDEKMNGAGDKKQMFEIARKNLSPYKEKGQIETFRDKTDFGGGLSSVFLPGHTPGHSGVRISDGKDQLLIFGDIIHVPAVQFARPDIAIAFDVDPETAKKTRAKILDEVTSDRVRIAGMHLVFPGAGHVAKQGAGYRYVPQAWESDV
jgi:glyoxylase-like metal-dependent hydrolase (beta-lactamase superfamily II)